MNLKMKVSMYLNTQFCIYLEQTILRLAVWELCFMALGLTFITFNLIWHSLVKEAVHIPSILSISFSKINLDRDYCLKRTLLKIPKAQTFHCKILFTKYFWHSERIRDSNLNFMTQKLEATLNFLSLEGTSKCHHKF